MTAGLSFPSAFAAGEQPGVLTKKAISASKPAAAASAVADIKSPEQVETSKIKDLTCTLAVNSDETNFEELGKMGGAFATSYRIKHMDVSYKSPNKVRFESRFLGASVVMIYNGPKKVYKTPIKSGESDVSTQPGQKQSMMDLGVFSTDYLTTDYKPTLLRKEGNLVVFDLTQRNTDNRSHEIVWVNPKTSITERRMSYNGDGILKKEMRYRKPVEVKPGIWVPTRIEIFNQFGKLAAVQDVEDLKVNAGVDESKFDVS